ncbi:MAG: hypothetical protein WC653_00905 [Candidatus Gracilibacteria bacterium]
MNKFTTTFQTLFLRNEKLSMLSLGGVMLLSLIIMGVISLTLLNDKAMKGYLLTKLENEGQELISDGEITEMLMLRARSMDAIEAQVAYMVRPEVVTYVMPISVVAQNQENAFE